MRRQPRQPSRIREAIDMMREIMRERSKQDMGGFARLKDDFDKWFPNLSLEHIWPTIEKNSDKREQAAFRYLYLRCLFEIAGNLDTIALCSRACMEQLEKGRAENTERFELVIKQFQDAMEALKHPPIIPFPVHSNPVPGGIKRKAKK